MREEKIYQNGRRITTVFHPAVPVRVCPKITGKETCGGQVLYIDSDGGRHVAEIFDEKWGTRDSARILPRQKAQYQRIRKMGR